MKKVTIEDPHRLLRALNQTLKILEDVGFGQPSYGFFRGGDPRHFTPDADSTELELERWKTDCEAYANGKKGPTPSSCSWNEETMQLPNEEGAIIDHQAGTVLVTTSFYGLGVTLNTDEADIFADLVDLKNQLEISARSDKGDDHA